MADKKPLSAAQAETLVFISSFIAKHGYSPTIREIQQAHGLKSPAPVQSRLYHLRGKGYITWAEGQARTIKVIEQGTRLLRVSSRTALILEQAFAKCQADGVDFDELLLSAIA